MTVPVSPRADPHEDRPLRAVPASPRADPREDRPPRAVPVSPRADTHGGHHRGQCRSALGLTTSRRYLRIGSDSEPLVSPRADPHEDRPLRAVPVSPRADPHEDRPPHAVPVCPRADPHEDRPPRAVPVSPRADPHEDRPPRAVPVSPRADPHEDRPPHAVPVCPWADRHPVHCLLPAELPVEIRNGNLHHRRTAVRAGEWVLSVNQARKQRLHFLFLETVPRHDR